MAQSLPTVFENCRMQVLDWPDHTIMLNANKETSDEQCGPWRTRCHEDLACILHNSMLWISSSKSTVTKHPTLWKSILNWAGWKEMRKVHLQHQQQKEQQQQQCTANEQQQNKCDNGVPLKCKSRWGNASSNQQQHQQQQPAADVHSNMIATTITTALPASLLQANNLPVERQRECQRLQNELKVVNDKLQSINKEAACVNASPHGHHDAPHCPLTVCTCARIATF